MATFSESQRFRQWWLWVILALALIVPLILTYVGISSTHQKPEMKDLLIGISLPISIFVWVLLMRLDVDIDATGIKYRFVGFHFRQFEIDWNEINKAYIREYSPIKEYGGWGLRVGLGGIGKAYNVSGNIGLQLELKTGKKVLFGTQRPDDIKALLEELARNKVISRDMIKK